MIKTQLSQLSSQLLLLLLFRQVTIYILSIMDWKILVKKAQFT